MHKIRGKVVGNPTVTPMPVPDWNQTNPNKADYIKNKPDIDKTIQKAIEESVGIANTELESILAGGVD